MEYLDGDVTTQITSSRIPFPNRDVHILIGNVTTQVCSYHVGGFAQWEFFLGDRPHMQASKPTHHTQPMQQIANTEHHADAGVCAS